MKRVASAVGEGSMAIQFVHEYLKEMLTVGSRQSTVASRNSRSLESTASFSRRARARLRQCDCDCD